MSSCDAPGLSALTKDSIAGAIRTRKGITSLENTVLEILKGFAEEGNVLRTHDDMPEDVC